MNAKGKKEEIRVFSTMAEKAATWWEEEGCEKIKVGLFYAKQSCNL